ncbi:unnamed protein product [Adineta ricciae]|uniref:G-protein coupled receptors family 1 profile domain-containing protein n=1 Tax=Adineta ricciae TaxID=249248 RepID=A0A815XN73_ADIRI|nr:unnamed protein product [Adineta ricciae]
MSSPSISFYTNLSRQITTYFGSTVLVVGVLGGILNLIVFLSLRTFRENSCAFYLSFMSFANLIHLLASLSGHIIIFGFGYDWTVITAFLCKSRVAHIQLWLLTSFTCVCFAIIDQFLSTSFNPRWHRWCNIKLARYAIAATIIFWSIHAIPFVIYYNIVTSPLYPNQPVCIITNGIVQAYSSFGYALVLMGILPLTIMTVFGILAYYNIQNLAYRTVPLVRRELDKQLTHMVLIQLIYNFFVLSPYVVASITLFYLPNDDLAKCLKVLSVGLHNCYFAVSNFRP